MNQRFARLLAASVGALALAAGAAATAPAASASIKPDCGWQSLTLFNGWQSAQSNWNTGDPAFCVVNSIVYLSGSLRNPTSYASEFALLPSYALPTSDLDLAVYTYNGSFGQLSIVSNGAMFASGGSAYQYTSLAGISFPVSGTSLQSLPLYPGWQSGQGQSGTGDPGYVILNGIVHWTGSVTGIPYSFGFAMLPPVASPDGCIEAAVSTVGGNVGDLNVWSPTTQFPADAPLMAEDTTNGTSYYAQLTSLAGVSYPASGQAAWQPLTLKNGWASTPPAPYCEKMTLTPSFYVQDHVVYLTGELEQNDAGSALIGTLPAAARPQHDLYLLVGGVGAFDYLHISPTGNMYAFGHNQSYPISLGDISYETSS